MNFDQIKNAAGQLGTAIAFLLVGAGIMTVDQSADLAHNLGNLVSAIGVAIPSILGVISVVSSVYRHWNQKKVPDAATAVILPATVPVPPVGQSINLTAAKGLAKVVGVLLIGLMLASSPVWAQNSPGIKSVPKITLPSPLPFDPLGLNPTINATKDQVSQVWLQIKAATQADLQYALALAKNANTPGSNIRAQCYAALIVANDQSNGVGLKNADGTPMVEPDPAAVTKVEQASELLDNLGATAPLMVSCAAAANAVRQNALQFIGTVLSAVAVKGVTGGIPLP